MMSKIDFESEIFVDVEHTMSALDVVASIVACVCVFVSLTPCQQSADVIKML